MNQLTRVDDDVFFAMRTLPTAMRDVYRATKLDDTYTYEMINKWYRTTPSNSLDGIGVALPENDKFMKIIKLDVHGCDPAGPHTPLIPKRGCYGNKEFYEEVGHATTAHRIGIGPKVFENGIVKEGKTRYGYIVFERLEVSLEDIIGRRNDRLDEKARQSVTPDVMTPKYVQAVTPCDEESTEDKLASDLDMLTFNTPTKRTPNIACTPELTTTLSKLRNSMLTLILAMKKNDFYHMDMHPGNIFKAGDDFKLIDYGRVVVKPVLPAKVNVLIPRSTCTHNMGDEDELLAYSMRHLREEIFEMMCGDDNLSEDWQNVLKVLSPTPSTPPTPK